MMILRLQILKRGRSRRSRGHNRRRLGSAEVWRHSGGGERGIGVGWWICIVRRRGLVRRRRRMEIEIRRRFCIRRRRAVFRDGWLAGHGIYGGGCEGERENELFGCGWVLSSVWLVG
ncbi:hypothetical protein LINGRAHAP2_LOCUS23042 [Linum grandiflorum]